MGRNSVEITSLVQSVVLIGRTGNGKSATANSILGRKAFKSKSSPSAVTTTCELQTTVLKDGQILNVIDTPGLFDSTADLGFIGKEIVKCISMANDGIHAVLLILSVRSRFTQEEAAAITTLQTLFGPNINDYMIIVFTGGDELEENEETLDDYLSHCHEPLKKILNNCGNRRVLFDNRTKDDEKAEQQVHELLSLVNVVVKSNGGPYTNELFTEFKMSLLREQLEKEHENQLNRMASEFESKLIDATRKVEQQLAEEKVARLTAELSAQAAQNKSKEEIRKLSEDLEKVQREMKEHQKQVDDETCLIL